MTLALGVNFMNKNIKIKISGVTGSGKTYVLGIIGKALIDAGLNVIANDDDLVKTEFNPIIHKYPKDRVIKIKTKLTH